MYVMHYNVDIDTRTKYAYRKITRIANRKKLLHREYFIGIPIQ